MERRLILVVLLFAVFETHCQAPTAAAGGLEVGLSYSFRYNTTVLLSELRPRAGGQDVKDVGYQILADARCAVIWQHPSDHWQQLLRITVSSPQLLVRSRRAPQPDGFSPHSSRLDSIEPVDVLLLTSSGGKPKLYRQAGRPEAETGLARGLVGLLNIRPEGKYRETDASGECDVTYRSEGPQTLVKTKDRCEAAAPVHTASHPVLDVSVTSERVTRYTLSAGRLESATSEERHSVTPAVRAGYGTLVTSLQSLLMTGGDRSAPSVSAATHQEALQQLADSGTLGWRPEETGLTAPAAGLQRHCDADSPCVKLSELVSELRSSLTEESVSSLAAAGASIALVPALRAASREEVAAVLADKRNKLIRLSLLDAAGAAQTLAVHSAVRKALTWPPAPSEDIEPHERYLVSLATASHPPRELVKELISECHRPLPSPELHQTLVLTAASVAAAYCRQAGDQICDGLSSELVTQLRACDSPDSDPDSSPACCLLPLRALANLRSASAMPTLIDLVMAAESGSECRAEALRALSALPADLTATLRPHLERLYGQPDRYDVTSRLLAADLLLASPRPTDAGQLLFQLENRNASEENAYILQRLKAAAATHRALQRSLRHLLSDGIVGNYDVLAQGALSSVLERKLWKAGDVSAGFSSQLEVAKSRALRRSGFSAQLEAEGHRLDILTFSVQAAGLSGLLGSPDPDDAADAQARLQLGLLGRQLRPRQLFSSQSELMGLLWSGAGSETTSALKGTVLLQDHLQEVPLQSGLSARLAVLAAVTFDLAGRIEVSLWNRAAQAELDDRAAVLLRGLATVHTPFVRARMEVSQALEARLDANTDIQFSDGPKTCARISHAPLMLREVVRKQERVPGSRHRLRRVRRRSRSWGGATFSLNQQNADNCRAMFG